MPPPYTSSQAHVNLRSTKSQFSTSRPIAQTQPTSTASANFQSIFTAALQAYTKKTKKDILSHPLASRLQGCDSPAAIIAVLQDQAGQSDGSWGDGEILAKFLNPTVHVLCAYSQVLGSGMGLVNIPLMCREFWSDACWADIPTGERSLYWYWYSPRGERFDFLLLRASDTSDL